MPTLRVMKAVHTGALTPSLVVSKEHDPTYGCLLPFHFSLMYGGLKSEGPGFVISVNAQRMKEIIIDDFPSHMVQHNGSLSSPMPE